MDALFSLLIMGFPVAVFAGAIRHANRHDRDPRVESHRRFSPGMWLGQGRG